MSSETVGWAFRHSPYRGTAFAIHVAIADSVNDQHDYELWMRQNVLAKKARTTRKTVGETLAKMVLDGLLELLAEGNGGANQYRFLMPPDTPVLYESRSGRGATTRGTYRGARPGTPGGKGATTGQQGGATPGGTEPKGDPKGAQEPPAADGSETVGHEVVRAFYDWCEAEGRPKPTLPAGRQGNQFMALVHIVQALLAAGWTVPEVKVALTQTRAFTTDAMTYTLTERRQQQRPPSGPRAPVDADRDAPSGKLSL